MGVGRNVEQVCMILMLGWNEKDCLNVLGWHGKGCWRIERC